MDAPCFYCEDGLVHFDFAYAMVGVQYNLEPSTFDFLRAPWAKVRKNYKSILKDFYLTYLPGVTDNIKINKVGNTLLCSTLAWTIEEAFVIIDEALVESGFPIDKLLGNKLIYVRTHYGMLETSRDSKYYDPSLGDKYRERLNQVGQVNEVLDSSIQ